MQVTVTIWIDKQINAAVLVKMYRVFSFQRPPKKKKNHQDLGNFKLRKPLFT